MIIDPALEERTRDVLAHVMRVEVDDFGRSLSEAASDGMLPEALALTGRVAAVVVVDLCDGKPPTDGDLREISDVTERIDTRWELRADEVHAYLARVVFGGEPLGAGLTPDDATRLPFIITANLLGSTADLENGQDWLAYLDAIETAIESAPDPT